MANSIWTIEEFACPSCSMSYTATREEHSARHTGHFKCGVCNAVVHSWSANHHFFGWKPVTSAPPVFGKRWADVR